MSDEDPIKALNPMETLGPIKATPQQLAENPALLIPAVARCWAAMRTAARNAIADIVGPGDEGYSKFKTKDGDLDLEGIEPVVRYAEKMSHLAYKEAMPPLSYAGNIRDFIACVGYGMLLDVFAPNEASKLLYAAQIATTAEAKCCGSKVG